MATIPLTCPFCNREGKFDFGDGLLEEDYYKCIYCPNMVTLGNYDGLLTVSMRVQVGDKFYNIDLWLPDYECSVYEISERGDWLETVLELCFVPDWNPTNIEVKLKKVLTFL